MSTKARRRFFDDRIYYDPNADQIWIGRPDTRTQGEGWTYWFTTSLQSFRRGNGPPPHWREIAREDEMTLCGSQ